FTEIAKDKMSQNGLLANAYLVKIAQESQDPSKAKAQLGIVMSATGKEAEPAQRLATYFNILYIRKNDEVKKKGVDKLAFLASQCEAWLKEYPSAKHTYLGESIRFEEALAELQVAATMTEGFKPATYEKLKKNQKDLTAFNTATKNVE